MQLSRVVESGGIFVGGLLSPLQTLPMSALPIKLATELVPCGRMI